MLTTLRPWIIACGIGMLLAGPARACVERVWVTHAGSNEVTVQRASGDLWRLSLNRQCPELAAYSGRILLIHYEVAFPGPEPRILIPEMDLVCRAARADSVGHHPPPAPLEPPQIGLGAMREALEGLGYNCGPLQERGWSPDAAQAFSRYRGTRRLDASAHGLKRAVTALAIDALGGKSPTASGQRRSQAIAYETDEIVDYLVTSGGAECEEPTFVRVAATDRTSFTLVDGSVWDVEARSREAVGGWLATDGVMACGGRLVNLRTGEMARVTRLR